MALLTLLLATRRGCRWLDTCQRFVDSSPRYSPVIPELTNRSSSLRPRESSQLRDRRTIVGIASSSRTSVSSKAANNVIEDGVTRELTNNRVAASLCLRRLFDFNAAEAERWVNYYTGFEIIDPADILRNYKACIKAGLARKTVKENPGILSYPNFMLLKKIEYIKKMEIANINDAVAFFYLDTAKLWIFFQKLGRECADNGGVNRIKYLSDQLEHRTFQVCNIMARYYFMWTIPYPRLVLNLKIMLDYKMEKTDILNDVWGFRYRPEVVMDRLKRARDAGVLPLKPWMIRCQEHCLARTIRNELKRRSVLGDDGTSLEYLSKRLGCEREQLERMMVKNPKLANVSAPKMKSVIDYLTENGYTKEELIRAPRILSHKLKTIKDRLEKLMEYGHKPESVYVFCKSRQEYERYLKKTKEGRKEATLAMGKE